MQQKRCGLFTVLEKILMSTEEKRGEDFFVGNALSHLLQAAYMGDAQYVKAAFSGPVPEPEHIDFFKGRYDVAEVVAERGHTECLAVLLEMFPFNARYCDMYDRALCAAAAYGQIECVQKLLHNGGAKLLRQKCWALEKAVANGHKNVVELLLTVTDPNLIHNGGLHVAVKHNRKDLVELLLPLSDMHVDKGRALETAARCGYTDIVAVLLTKCDPSVNGSEAVVLATEHRHTEIVRLLCNVSKIEGSEHAQSAIVHAIKNNDMECFSLLLPTCWPDANQSKALRLAAKMGLTACVQSLLPISNARDHHSEALYNAAHNGHADIVAMLLPVSDAKAQRSQALSGALHGGHWECVRLLIPHSDPESAEYAQQQYALMARGQLKDALQNRKTHTETEALARSQRKM